MPSRPPSVSRSLARLLPAALLFACNGDNPGQSATDTTTSTTSGLSTSTDPGTTAPTTGETMVFLDFGGGSESDSDTDSGTTTIDPPPPPFCGDGNVDPGESCDDGDANANDAACTLACELATCGDGHVQARVEECDTGRDNGPGQPCKADCTANICGDGDKGPGEGCDDGNQIDDDECTNTCKLTSCGDGQPQPGEECDDGNNSQPSPAVRPRSAAPSLLGSDRRSAGVFALPLRHPRGPPCAGTARNGPILATRRQPGPGGRGLASEPEIGAVAPRARVPAEVVDYGMLQ
ncbi:MAG: DUF4215 domain-containing protein [Nannocystis sp.]|nr:DUF4215 domain-containing protein [Nannocystis sp.]